MLKIRIRPPQPVKVTIAGSGGGTIYPEYDGAYAVTPAVEGQALPTAQRLMREDLTVRAIPFFDVTNPAGGSTVYIGEEIEINGSI